MKQKILLIIGTRPEAIKMAPVALALRQRADRFDCRLLCTGQHRELMQGTLELFGLTADLHLDAMREGQSLAGLTARLLTGVAEAIDSEHPDWVLVHGDTATSTAAALAAFYARVPVAHVEAGLRTDTPYSPFPEEMNRRLTARLATLHLAPTERARRNLLREGVADGQIAVTGNTVVDAVRLIAGEQVAHPQDQVLFTCHRRENFGQPMEHIFHALLRLAAAHPKLQFVYPVHPNPEVRGTAARLLAYRPANLRLVESLGYRELLATMAAARLVVTDSGGLQEEAVALGRPVVVLRDSTERPEAVESGWARLAGSDEERILAAAESLLAAPPAAVSDANPFGDGHAADRIADLLTDQWTPSSGSR